MKSFFFSICILIGISNAFSQSSGNKKVRILVTEGQKAIPQAIVSYEGDSISTNENGVAEFEIISNDPKTIHIIVHKQGYSKWQDSLNLIKNKDLYSLNAVLQKEIKIKLLRIKILSEDTREPIVGARVEILGYNFSDTYGGNTNHKGELTISLPSPGNVEVTAKHDEFMTQKQPLTISFTDDQPEYQLSFQMKRKRKPGKQ